MRYFWAIQLQKMVGYSLEINSKGEALCVINLHQDISQIERTKDLSEG